jgi:hypothetical protein
VLRSILNDASSRSKASEMVPHQLSCFCFPFTMLLCEETVNKEEAIAGELEIMISHKVL